MCGVCALKPTYGRHLSKIGMRMPHERLELVLPRPVGGFLAAEVDGLVDAYKAYWGMRKNPDATIVPLPFDKEKFSKKQVASRSCDLRFALLTFSLSGGSRLGSSLKPATSMPTLGASGRSRKLPNFSNKRVTMS